MMRSLWAGVSGLQAHQIAMDVEGNNISNVNTTGFKYSRVSFSDMLSQTAKIATAPQGDLGGKNSLQIGLGTTANSVNRIFSQGSIQSTDKNTDLAIQGDGFFVVSDDAGKTFKYTRDGDFKFDAKGNFTTNGGLIVQGWTRDSVTNNIDATSPIGNIQIVPGQTIQAQPSSVIALKANLNSGSPNTQTAVTYALTDPYITSTTTSAFNRLYNETGSLFSIEDGQGITLTLTDAATPTANTYSRNFVYRTNPDPTTTPGEFNTIEGLMDELNKLTAAATGLDTGITVGVNNAGQLTFTTVDTDSAASGDPITIGVADYYDTSITSLTSGDTNFTDLIFMSLDGQTINDNITGTTGSILVNKPATGEDFGVLFNAAGNSYDLANGQGMNIGFTPAIVTTDTAITSGAISFATGELRINNVDIDGYTNADTSLTALENAAAIMDLINQKTTETGVTASLTGPDSAPRIVLTNSNAKDVKNIKFEDLTGGAGNAGLLSSSTDNEDVSYTMKEFRYTDGSEKQVGWDPLNSVDNQTAGTFYFRTTEDLRVALQQLARETNSTATVDVSSQGKFVVSNKSGSTDLMTVVDGISDSDTVENSVLTASFASMAGSVPVGQGSKTSQGLFAAIHSASIDVYDSLGSKHTVKMDFRKESKTNGSGATWGYKLTVPIPGEITGAISPVMNVLTGGQITFNANGSLGSYTIPSITYTPNNGSTPDQSINLDFGTINGFDGITSFASVTTTGGISQDGFPGGDLIGIRVDQTGNLIGSFTNGRSLALAQVAMAKFANNEGLMSEGGNIFTQSSNSGDPIIGTANTGGRGYIQSSSLEMSNVDLSRSFTNLIIIQRGYQANSKTITTSDQLLNSLLQLKQ